MENYDEYLYRMHPPNSIYSYFGLSLWKNCQNHVRKLKVLIISNLLRKDIIFLISRIDKSQGRTQNPVVI